MTAATTNDRRTVRLASIGVGGRGLGLLNTALGIPGIAITAICDADAGRCASAAEAVKKAGQPAPMVAERWADVLARHDVDGVISALPIDLHERNYLDVIAAGKDLYGEKPMCLTARECDAVVRAAQASRQIVQIGFQRRADPRFIETMGQVHAGELGELIEGRIAWSNAWGPGTGWFGRRARSGDWMVEQAVHNWDVMNWANQCLPKRAMGMGRGGLFRDLQLDRDVTDYYSAVVEYENGVIVNILHSWVAPGQPGTYNRAFNEEFTRLIGTRGGIDFNTGTFSYRKETKLPDRVGHSYTGEIDGTKLALEAFANSVRTRNPSVATAAEGRDAVLACLLVREAVYREGVASMEEIRRG